MKKAVNIFRSSKFFEVALLFITVGFIFSIIMGSMFLNNKGVYKEINASVTAVEASNMGKKTLFSLSLSYKVDGNQYESQIYTYDSNYKVGDNYKCEYNADNPSELRDGDSSAFIVSFFIISLGVFAYGIILLIRGFKTAASEYSQYDSVNESDIESFEAKKSKA